MHTYKIENISKVSIIVPIYNLEQYLPKCLDSIINQTMGDIEIILVNDGSTDLSGVICEQYKQKDKRIKVIHQQNMGLSGARNTGIENINSKWFTIIDADDWYEPEAISILYNYAESYNSDIFIASFYANKAGSEWKDNFFNVSEFHFNSKDDIVILESSCMNPCSIANKNCSTNVGVTWARLYKTEFIKKNKLKFIVGLKRMQDAIFNINAFELAKKIDFVDVPVQHYRLWDGSASKKYNPTFHETALWIADELNKFIKTKEDRETLYLAYNAKIVCLVIEILLLELVHKQSTKNHKEKKIILREICNNKLFQNAIKNVKLNDLTNGQGIAAILLKLKLYDLILFIYLIKEKTEN